jgi:hypothetical protein
MRPEFKREETKETKEKLLVVGSSFCPSTVFKVTKLAFPQEVIHSFIPEERAKRFSCFQNRCGDAGSESKIQTSADFEYKFVRGFGVLQKCRAISPVMSFMIIPRSRLFILLNRLKYPLVVHYVLRYRY